MVKEGSPRRLAGLTLPGACSHFGEAELDATLFTSIKSIENAAAAVNGAFLRSFKNRLTLLRFQRRNHLIQQNRKFNNSHDQVDLCCVTFGIPLVGNGGFVHALHK
ncbi:hypothetical protein ZIOFF_059324 [Zingiber officinale]|uniref:Uncharacterized protein n=1 Tax=Zingiber officinale TaxID=94328 RepID=A0A8J5KK63_ZINOF|nr:hypothetical protein ZIOFF_059324 [Zingiber officinale]